MLISPYDIGRQPYALAQAAAWLQAAGFATESIDLSITRLDERRLAGASLVAISLGMHTATRLASQVLPRIRAAAPTAHICCFGLYAPGNEAWLRELGVDSVLAGEVEAAMVALAESASGPARSGSRTGQHPAPIQLARLDHKRPYRADLPSLDQYAALVLPDGRRKICGFTEATRGCKHLCRHCPVVPVYGGRFTAIRVDRVLDDIEQQVRMGAEHISFGDPDFLNGPTHARRVVEQLHARFPQLSYDVTVKVEHLLRHQALLPVLARTGCVLITSAVEAVDDLTLEKLDKGHQGRDFDVAARYLKASGIAMAPTFVAFTPWTTLESYRALLERLLSLRLVEAVPPVQLALRLLIPSGSRLLETESGASWLGAYDPALLGYPWRHPDPRVDRLQAQVMTLVESASVDGTARGELFRRIWAATHEAQALPVPEIGSALGDPVPYLSEAWYCCAEPTEQQLAAL